MKRIRLALLIGGLFLFQLFQSNCAFNTDRLEELPPMNIPRYNATSVVLNNGKILILSGSILKKGIGYKTPTPNELFAPKTKKFTPVEPLQLARWRPTANLLPDGKVLIVGGFDSNTAINQNTEIFDPISKTFTVGPQMLEPRKNHPAYTFAGLANGKVSLGAAEIQPCTSNI